MNEYRAVVRRRTRTDQSFPDEIVTVTSPNIDEAKRKAVRHVFWNDKKRGKTLQYELVSIAEVEDRPDIQDPEQELVRRAIEIIGDSPYEIDSKRKSGAYSTWASRCHEISLALVKAGLFGAKARVARGWCDGVTSQHSWIAVSGDCYDRKALIVDPTLHTYREDVDDILWKGTLLMPGWHHPHGQGRIWEWGRPYHHGGDDIALDRVGLSSVARTFLDMIEPLDREGWHQLAHAPVEGWPAREIIERMYDTPILASSLPIDIVGMATERNPEGLYR